MGFIAYAHHIESSCKLLSFNKHLQLNEVHEKNRIFVTGTSCMSTKMGSSVTAQAKAVEALNKQPIFFDQIKRGFMLDRHNRNTAMKKMRDCLQTVIEMQNKYVDLADYKKYCCIDIEKAVPMPERAMSPKAQLENSLEDE